MTTLQLTDGTTTLNLADESSYCLIDQSWSPAVATRRRDALAGLPYTNVIESLSLRIKGSSTADCLDKLHDLTSLLDQADRWRLGEDVDAVLLKYKPAGSVANVLSATVLGSPPDGTMVIVPGRVEWIEENNYQLFPVLVSFVRIGAWLDDEESDSSSISDNPTVLTATNTATDLPSPVKLQLSNFKSVWFGGSFLLKSDDADKFEIFTASTMTATGFAAANDSSKNPLDGTNILEYTPSDTNWAYSGQKDISSLLLSDTTEIAIYINAVIVSAGMEAQVKARIEPVLGASTALQNIETRPVELESANNNPQWYFLGIIKLPAPLGNATNQYLQIAIKTDTTTSTVGIDAVCLMDVRNGQSIYIPSNELRLVTDLFVLDHALLTSPEPRHIMNTSEFMLPTEGARIITAQDGEVAGIWLATGVDSSLNRYWCGVDDAGNKLSNALTAVRRPAYLVPQ